LKLTPAVAGSTLRAIVLRAIVLAKTIDRRSSPATLKDECTLRAR
jgi:hypothetical protein